MKLCREFYKQNCLLSYLRYDFIMKQLLFVFVLLFLLIGSVNSDDLSEILSPENYSGTSVELKTKEIKIALKAKENGKSVLGNDWMIVTANSFASAAGAEILKSGGTAADAMIAAQAVLGLVEPESSGLGGGSFLVWFDSKTNKITTLDGRETAPQFSKMTQFQNNNGDSKKFFDAVIGGLSVGTPGTPALMHETHNRWGKMNWASLFSYAIKLSEEGFTVSKKLETSIERDSDRLQKIVKTKNYFLPDGVGLKQKQIVINSAYARTLRKIANDGIEDFYNGSIANDIIDTVQNYKENPGFLNKSDLSNYIVIERDPVCINYREFNVCGMGPPSSGGVAVAQTLKILEKHDLKSLGHLNPLSWQLIGDASRLAFADRDRYLADSDFVEVPIKGLLEDEYIKARSDQIILGEKTENIDAGNPSVEFVYEFGDDKSLELNSTTHISIYDSYGNALSMTSSIENAFGSRLMTKSGFLLNNQLTDFSFQHQVDGRLVSNRLEPRKRPRSSMSPTIVLKNKKPIYITGSPGGSNIIGFVTNSLISLIDWDMSVQESVSLPHAINRWGKYEIEESIIAPSLEKSLSKMGYDTKIRKYFSGLNTIYIGKNLEGGSDPRREGIAIGN